MSAEAIEALLFDLGGVLLEIDFARVMHRWSELAGVDGPGIASRFTHGEAYERHERGEIEAPEYFAALRRELGVDLTDAQLEDGWNRVFVDSIAPTVALLRPLAGRIPLHVFSNTNRTHYDHWSRHYTRDLEAVGRQFLSFEMGLRKPERQSFEHVARELGMPLDRILFFDDTPANVGGAQAAGMSAVLVRSPEDVARAVAPWLGPPGTKFPQPGDDRP